MSSTSSAERGRGQHFDGDLRRALLDAAAAAIGERGVDAVSLREVARRAGVSHAAPAHHFGDKSGLYTALAAEGFTWLADTLAIASGGPDPVDELVALGRAYIRFATDHPAHFEVMFRPTLLRVDDPAFLAAADRAYSALAECVTRCHAAGWGGTSNPAELSTLAWAMAHGLGALRAQGALARYAPDPSLDGATALLALFNRALDQR